MSMGIHLRIAHMSSIKATTRPFPRTRPGPARAFCIQEDLQSLLQKAHKKTFEHEPGQLYGRAGRRCTLEDGERILERCTRMYPNSLEARLMMAHNLSRQNSESWTVARDMLTISRISHVRYRGRQDKVEQALSSPQPGREREVPGLALQALALDTLQLCETGSAAAESALELIRLGLDALQKSELASSSDITEYKEEAKRLVPQLANQIEELAGS